MTEADDDTATQPTTPRRKRRRWRRFWVFLLIVLMIVGVYAGVKYRQWSTRPDHWERNREMLAMLPDEQKRERASSFMGRITEEWTAFGEATAQELIESPDAAGRVLGDERVIVIPFDDLNIMLEMEMPSILASQGAPVPDAFKGMMATSDGDGRLVVAFEYDGPELHQVFSITLEINVDARGRITSRMARATGGELALPRDQALERIAEIVGGEREVGEIRLMKLFTGEPFGPMDLPIDPGEGGVRNGRITGIQITDDALHITRLTVARKPAPAEAGPPNMQHDD